MRCGLIPLFTWEQLNTPYFKLKQRYNTGLFKMIVGVLTTCNTQYTWDRSTRIFLFNRPPLQVFVTYLTGALYVHPLWFYKHQHDNRVRSKLFPNLVRNCRWTIVTDRHSWNVCTRKAFSLPFAAILVNCAPSGEMHNYCMPHIIKENFENFLIHRCNYIWVLLSQVYCVWKVVKTPTVIFNNPVFVLLVWSLIYYTNIIKCYTVSKKSCNFLYPPSFCPSIWIICNAASWTSFWT
jgi:hypothetical protein